MLKRCGSKFRIVGSGMRQKMIRFCKKEVVLVIATILAVLSAFIVPPSAAYFSYIDWHVLGVLLSLMIVMCGLQRNGFFDVLGVVLLGRTKKVWQLVTVLVLLCFFLSMAITNDVALITFVPFAVVTLEKCKLQRLLVPVVVLQTIAANLGSMFTPIGNPQNLYLYNLSGMSITAFLMHMLPWTVLSLVMLLVSILFIKGKNESIETEKRAHHVINFVSVGIYLFLFVLAFLVVLKVLPFEVVLIIVVATVFLIERSVLKDVDYALIFTFISFFIFTGNIGNIPVMKDALELLVEGKEVLVAVLASQCISNVPAALLLSGFTTDYDALLIGVNLGGLGTLIASMASLISYKILANHCNEKKGKYFIWFTLVNIIFLLILLCAYYFYTIYSA